MKIRVSGPGGSHVGMFGRPMMFREGEGDPKPGGGGDGKEGDAEKKLTELVNSIVHKAMSERDKRADAKLTKTLEGFQTKMMEELGKLFEVKKGEGEGEGKKGEGEGGDKKKDELSPEVRASLQRAERDAKEAKEKAEKWEREAKAASDKARKTEERNLVVSSLNGKVKPALMDMVVDQLHTRHVVRDADDETKILWKNADGELLPFKDGVEAWMKSDFGKEVKPPVDARGSGGRGGDGSPGSSKDMNMEVLGGIIANSIPGSPR